LLLNRRPRKFLKPDQTSIAAKIHIGFFLAPAKKAFITANIEACKKLLETETNNEKRYKLEWTLSGYEADLDPIILYDEALSE